MKQAGADADKAEARVRGDEALRQVLPRRLEASEKGEQHCGKEMGVARERASHVTDGPAGCQAIIDSETGGEGGI